MRIEGTSSWEGKARSCTWESIPGVVQKATVGAPEQEALWKALFMPRFNRSLPDSCVPQPPYHCRIWPHIHIHSESHFSVGVTLRPDQLACGCTPQPTSFPA